MGFERPAHRAAGIPVTGGLKRFVDILGALVLGVVSLPLTLSITLALCLEGGPRQFLRAWRSGDLRRQVLFGHARVGCEGAEFQCLKFRSMRPMSDEEFRQYLESHPQAQAEWLRDQKLKVDPRVTRVGRFLRRTSLDELPQLWNVLRGDMSLVGPRPIVHEELIRYGRYITRYKSVRPGLTGLWQVTGRNDSDYQRRVRLDAYYIRRQNLVLDCYILLRTANVVLKGSGAY